MNFGKMYKMAGLLPVKSRVVKKAHVILQLMNVFNVNIV